MLAVEDDSLENFVLKDNNLGYQGSPEFWQIKPKHQQTEFLHHCFQKTDFLLFKYAIAYVDEKELKNTLCVTQILPQKHENKLKRN